MTPASVGFHCPECVAQGRATVRAPRRSRLRGAADRWGPVTLSLIAINVAMFVLTAASAGLAGGNPLDNFVSPLFLDLQQVPVLVRLGEWWRPLTAAFLHIGPLHLVLNMLALLVFGAELERALGRARFLVVYFFSVLGGAMALQLFGHPGQPVAGASTAIYGLFGALGVLMLARRQDLRGLVTLLVINIVISFLPGVSLLGHLGGLVIGTLTAAVLVGTRRSRPAQLVALVVLGLGLVIVTLTAPTLTVLTI